MRFPVACILLLPLLLPACVNPEYPVTSRYSGNLELRVRTLDGSPVDRAAVYLDGRFIGHAGERGPLLFLDAGERLLRVELEGYQPYETEITILGQPNQQFVNVALLPL
ncbi:MAG: PEGA domain-containing protein [Planctomycetota bacterium]|nr:MAG: PEGA domain-containing protein [Planctomycetota bacterium]